MGSGVKHCSWILLHLCHQVFLSLGVYPGRWIPPGFLCIHTYILVHVYLPVAFLSDWDPVDWTFVQRMVYSPQNQLTTILGVISSESRKQFNTDMGVCQHAPMRLHLKSKSQITALSTFRYRWLKALLLNYHCMCFNSHPPNNLWDDLV